MFERRRLFVFTAFALAFLAVLVLAFVLSNAHAEGRAAPTRVAVMPGRAWTGQALMVSFWGAEPDSAVAVKVQDADAWVCRGDSCGMEHLSMPTLLVKADGRGRGYFAVGVPCGYPSGLFRMDVGGQAVSVPVSEGTWCRRYADWISGMR